LFFKNEKEEKMSQENNESNDMLTNLSPILDDLPLNEGKDDKPSASSAEEQITCNINMLKLSDISEQLSSLNDSINKRLSYDETKEKAFDRLYNELDQLKKNTLFDHLRPLYIDLILLYDRIENMRQKILSSDENISIPLLLETLSEELVEILYRREIEPLKNRNLIFNPSYQQAIGVKNTDMHEEDNHIERVVRRGFGIRERILRPEEVIVKKFKPSQKCFDLPSDSGSVSSKSPS
jgi:molecular chaperone GrpE